MKIKTRLAISIFGLSAIILFMFSATWLVTAQQKNDGLVINLAGRQRMLSQKMVKELLMVHRAGDKSGALIKNATDTMAVFDKTLSALTYSGMAPLSLDPAGAARRQCPAAEEPALSQLKTVERLWKTFAQKMEAALSAEGKSPEVAWVTTNNLELLAAMNKAVGMMQRQSEKRVSTLLLLQSCAIAAGILLAAFALFTGFTVARSLKRAGQSAGVLAEGNLTLRFRVGIKNGKAVNELGELSESLNGFVDRLHGVMGEISASAGNLGTSAMELDGIAGGMQEGSAASAEEAVSVAASAEQMSGNMITVAAAMEELSTNTEIVAASADVMLSTIDDIAKNTDSASASSQKAVLQVTAASEKVDELGSAATEVGKVTEAITEISEQTNLLALNATIEAARAGEAGKGFAVVASEIKELAKQTAQATEEIKEKILWIQGATDSTVTEINGISRVMDEMNGVVSEITASVNDQSHSTREIVTNVAQGAEALAEVNRNVGETSAGAAEVAASITGVSGSAEETSRSSAKVTNNAALLSSEAGKLKEIVGRFTL